MRVGERQARSTAGRRPGIRSGAQRHHHRRSVRGEASVRANPASEVYSCAWGFVLWQGRVLTMTASATAAGRDEGSPPRAAHAIAASTKQ